MKSFLLALSLLAPVVMAVVMTAKPTFGQDSGTVTATVSLAAIPTPCLTVSTPSIDYGQEEFSGLDPFVPVSRTNIGSLTIVSCASGLQNIAVRGTNARGSGTGAWTLNDGWGVIAGQSCPAVLDQFGHLVDDDGDLAGGVRLSTTSQPVGTIAAGATDTGSAQLTMPCTGSSGAGETMRTDIIFTATIP